MKPFITLAQAMTPDGAELTLHRRDSDFFLRVNREPLMATNAVESEKCMARLACAGWPPHKPTRVLVGGLGLGFTLRQVLESAGKNVTVQVAELVPEIVAWNRRFLADVNGRLLDDPRVQVSIKDVFSFLQPAPLRPYDAILLDVDNGATALVQRDNARLYGQTGLALLKRALKPGGRAVFWSATPDRTFAKQLTQAGFAIEIVAAKAHAQAKRAAHTLFVAENPRLDH